MVELLDQEFQDKEIQEELEPILALLMDVVVAAVQVLLVQMELVPMEVMEELDSILLSLVQILPMLEVEAAEVGVLEVQLVSVV
jgi:hypothetical protein